MSQDRVQDRVLDALLAEAEQALTAYVRVCRDRGRDPLPEVMAFLVELGWEEEPPPRPDWHRPGTQALQEGREERDL